MGKKLIMALLLLLTTACAPWVKTDAPFTSAAKDYSVEPPHGWNRRNTDEFLLVTRDGLQLQNMYITRKNITEEKQFPHTRKRITSGMLPHELAEVVIDNYQSDTDNPVEAIEENVPETISGKPAFRVRLVYGTKSGLRYRSEIYGLLNDNWFYEIVYIAPARHYFDRNLAEFQNMVKTFRLAGQ